MNNEIRLLDASLLSDKKKLKEISYWLKVMNRPNGWHYDLDQIWILKELEKANILPGSTILDAGAGQGVTQYLLAARGYNVISLDFSPRIKLSRSLGIFRIEGGGDAKINYQHPYMEFINYGGRSSKKVIERIRGLNLRKVLLLVPRVFRNAYSFLFYLFERHLRDHTDYGLITYLRAPFHDIPLASGSIDAVISISAIEHADRNLFRDNIIEMLRVNKPGAPFFLTTSAVQSGGDIYHDKSAGWCFSFDTLKTIFPGSEIHSDSENCARSIIESEIFINRLDPYYYQDTGSFCYKKRVEALPYLPVAVKVVK
jgi:ubiquinone/menaquinone biosynthesis C-methylase UbiE